MKKQGVMILIKKESKFLFLIRNKKSDNFHIKGIYLPMGGHVELGESIEGAAIREAFEESGLKIKSLQLKGILYSRVIPGSGFDDWINFLFISEDFDGECRDGEEGRFEWIDQSRISYINIYDGMKIFLRQVINNNFTVMESLHGGHDLVNYKVISHY